MNGTGAYEGLNVNNVVRSCLVDGIDGMNLLHSCPTQRASNVDRRLVAVVEFVRTGYVSRRNLCTVRMDVLFVARQLRVHSMNGLSRAVSRGERLVIRRPSERGASVSGLVKVVKCSNVRLRLKDAEVRLLHILERTMERHVQRYLYNSFVTVSVSVAVRARAARVISAARVIMVSVHGRRAVRLTREGPRRLLASVQSYVCRGANALDLGRHHATRAIVP